MAQVSDPPVSEERERPPLGAPAAPSLEPRAGPAPRPRRILVTGATGYIGSRLVPRLLERGHTVRVLARHPSRLADRPWAPRVEFVKGDVLEPESLRAALADIDVAYYLVHSMATGRGFVDVDRRGATNFARAAGSSVTTVYLGGILPPGPRASEHLRSRAEVGEILGAARPTTEFRAATVIGSGSGSFELIRYVTERFPFMIVPRCFRNLMQPIAVRDVLQYLVLAADRPGLGVVEIGGADRLSFKQMIETYGALRGFRRRVVPFPLPFVPQLAARWVALTTPVPYELAAPLMAGLRSPLVADTGRAREAFPQVTPMPYRRAAELALERIREERVESHWSGALGGGPAYELRDWEGVVRELRTVHVATAPERVFRTVAGLGGDRGWLTWEWAWRVRGWIDTLAGGPGLRRGRRHPTELMAGEALDFWRVEAVQPPRLLRLRAEMRVPGLAWLQWEVAPEGDGSRLTQTAAFAPRGFKGTLYWYSLYPIHSRIFGALVRAIAREATDRAPASQDGVGGPGAGAAHH